MKFGLLIVNLICIVDSTYVKCGPNESCRCHHINVMDCSGNETLKLRRVCDFIFNANAVYVTELYVERNGYEHIGKEDLKGCSSLKSLFLGNNGVSNVEEFSFANFGNLETLDISFNQLNVYDFIGKLISTPGPLKKLMMNGNLNVYENDSDIYPDLSNFTHIEILTMDGMKDKIFPVSYRDMLKLDTLSLSGLNGNCSIPYITNSTFQNLHHVRVLNLSSCGTLNIDAGAFESLINLEVLDLSQNMNLGFRILNNISYSLQYTKIKTLNFSKVYTTFGMGTQLKLSDVCYLWNTSLTELVLNSNRIQLIETNVLILIPNTLKIVRVEDNKFTFGLYLLQLGCFSNLEKFYGNYQNLAHNPRQYWHEPYDNVFVNNTNFSCPFTQSLLNISESKENCDFFNDSPLFRIPTWPTTLKRLEFSTCGMQYTLPNFKFMQLPLNLEYLDGSGNILYSWVGPLSKFPNIKYLNLSRNYCSHIGKEFFESFASVENLQIQENFLGLVLSNNDYGPFVFDKLGYVTVLNLSSNIISYLYPDVFSSMSRLMTLDLSVNNIESFNVDVDNLNSLIHLNLKTNFIHSLPFPLREKLVSNSERLKRTFTIDLSNNTLSISCDEMEFLKWIVNHKKNMINFDNYAFHNMSGKRVSAEQFVKDVNSLDMDCRSYTSIIVSCSIGLSVFLSVVFGGVIYKNRWKLRYLMRVNKIKHFGYTRLHQLPNEVEMFLFDAFISYANDDLHFILDKITPKLEEQEMKICLHEKDFLPGNNIADNILQAIRNSRKTVIVLSKGFMKSKWCLFEFNMARMESIYARGGNSCLIVIMLEDVPTRNMSNEMLDWMKSNTYIEYTTEPEGEVLFWDNFLHVLKE